MFIQFLIYHRFYLIVNERRLTFVLHMITRRKSSHRYGFEWCMRMRVYGNGNFSIYIFAHIYIYFCIISIDL